MYDDGSVKGVIQIENKEIKKLFVEPVLQGNSIGSILLKYAIDEHSASTLWALEKIIRTIRFYERHEFHMTADKKLEEDMVNKLRYGNTNTFLIPGEKGYLLVDTDYAGTLPIFYGAIKQYNIKVSDISYVLATHYHPDHIGLVSELMKQGVKLLVIDTQYSNIHYSDEIFSRDKRLSYEVINEKDAIVISCKESRRFLKDMGISGEIISTTSHSEDSISLVLDNGVCIVGDLEPIEYLDAYEENIELKADWEHVMSYNPKRIYYAHVNEKVFFCDMERRS